MVMGVSMGINRMLLLLFYETSQTARVPGITLTAFADGDLWPAMIAALLFAVFRHVRRAGQDARGEHTE